MNFDKDLEFFMIRKFLFALLLFVIAFNFSVRAQLKGDPWIFNAYKELYGRQPGPLELNIKLYNGGSWNNYGELKTYVQQFQSSLQQLQWKISYATIKNNSVVGLFENGKQIAVDFISNDGGSIIPGGAGNIVAAGAGNIIGQDGSGIATSDLPGLGFANSHILQAGTKAAKSGKGALIIKRK